MLDDFSRSSKQQNGKAFVSGVLLLSFSTVIVKIIGLVYKIPMLSLLGAEGMGYFNSSYEIFALLCLVATTGLPVSISILISSAMAKSSGMRERKGIFKNAILIAIAFGATGSLLLLLFSNEISTIIGNSNASASIFAIAPALLFVCVAGVYRGYFQGMNRMYPTAVSQIIEVVGKLVFGVSFSYFALKKGYGIDVSAASAALGLALGMMLSMLFLIIQKRIKDKNERATCVELIEENATSQRYFALLLKIAIPITMSSVIMGITRITDMTLIFRRLQDIGITVSEANEMYGAYTTLAVPVFSLIPSLITPVALALVPALSSAIKLNSQNDQAFVSQNSLKFTVLFALPASFGLSAFAGPVLNILFVNQSENVKFAAPLLAILGASVLFSCIITTSNAILHAYMKTGTPIIAMLCGAIVKIVSEYFLIGNAEIGIFGAPISTLICDFTVAIINLANVVKLAPRTKDVLSSLWRILVASLGAVFAAVSVYLPLTKYFGIEILVVLSAALVAGIAYFALVFLLKGITLEELALFPFGDRLTKLFKFNKKYINKDM